MKIMDDNYVPRWVLHVLTPSAIIFLGDLIDEASETTNTEDQARFYCSAKSQLATQ